MAVTCRISCATLFVACVHEFSSQWRGSSFCWTYQQFVCGRGSRWTGDVPLQELETKNRSILQVCWKLDYVEILGGTELSLAAAVNIYRLVDERKVQGAGAFKSIELFIKLYSLKTIFFFGTNLNSSASGIFIGYILGVHKSCHRHIPLLDHYLYEFPIMFVEKLLTSKWLIRAKGRLICLQLCVSSLPPHRSLITIIKI